MAKNITKKHVHAGSILLLKSSKKTLNWVVCVLLGVIIVELFLYLIVSSTGDRKSQNSKLTAERFFTQCSNQRDWRTCYGKLFKQLVKNQDIQYAVAVIHNLQHLDARTRDCHIPAHYSAIAAVEKDPTHWQNFIKKLNISDCNYGFLHGTLEGLSEFDPNFQLDAESIPKICEIFADGNLTKDTEQGCSHAMGHILLGQTCTKTVEEGIRKSVDVCSALPSSFRIECYSGVFMESFTRDNLAVHCNTPHIAWGTEPEIKREEEICNSYTGEAAIGCWYKISYMYNALSPHNPPFVYEKCSRAPNSIAVLECYLNAAEHEMIYKEDADREYFASICKPLEKDDASYRKCYRNVTGSIIYASSKFAPRAIEFCYAMKKEFQGSCFSQLTNLLIRKVNLSERLNYCQLLPETFRSSCIGNSK